MLARPAMKKLRERVDPRGYNGAMFLGLNGIAVKSHGGPDALGFANAIGVAVDMHRHGIIEKIRSDLSLLDRNPGNAPAAVRSEERRVGKRWVITCRFRWSPDH